MRSGIGSLITAEAFFLDRGDGMAESPDPT